MRIRRLELCGFKSFSERTVFQFSDRVSCVVGPNGCGKSNVIDAIRWLLGEQNPRLLRGQGMEDVIFGGTSARKATGLAEATLVLDNSDGRFGERYKHFSEIEISRRLYRDGESAYLLNGTRCRLRDIIDLFMDTGVGARACSVIEQGKVTHLISSKPEQRRVLIEEAAGIVGYKARRQEAQRRLEATEQNLLRVGDLVDELRRQANGLRRQASKANRYRRLQAQRKENEILLALAETRDRTGSYRDWMAKLTDLQTARDEIREQERMLRVELDAQREQLRNADSAVSEIKEAQARLRTEMQGHEGQREFAGREIAHLEERLVDLERETEDAQQRSSVLAEQERELRKETEERQLEMDARSVEQEKRNRAVSGFAQALTEKLGRVDGLRRDGTRLDGEVDRLRLALGTLERKVASHGARTDILERERQEAETVLRRARETQARAESELNELDADVAIERAHQAEVIAEVEVRNEVWAGMMASLEELGGMIRERDARRQSLAEVLDRREGFGRGVQAVMKKQSAENGTSGILGTVADMIEVPARYEQAVEAALGHSIQSVLVETQEHGLSALNYLKERDSGRTSFVPLGHLRPKSDGGVIGKNGILAEACDVVQVADDYQEVAEHLLGDVVVVEDLPQAMDIWRANGHRKRLVTMEGDVIDASGVVTGGGQLDGGVLGQKRELRDLEAELVDLRGEEEKANVAKEEISAALQQLEEDRQATQQRLHQLDVRRAQLDSELKTSVRELGAASRKMAAVDAEADKAAAVSGSLAKESKQARARLAEVETERGRVGIQLEEISGEADELRRQRDEHQGKAFEAELALADARGRLSGVRERLEQIASTSAEVRSRMEREHEERKRIQARIIERRQLAADSEQGAERAARELEENGILVNEAIKHREGLAEQGKRLESGFDVLREKVEGLDGQLHEASTRVTTLNVELEHLRDGLMQQFRLDLKKIFGQFEEEGELVLTVRGTLPRPLGDDDDESTGDEEEPPVEAASGQELERQLEPVDGIQVTFTWEQLLDQQGLEQRRQQLDKARRDLERIGEINMNAPEAYEEVKAKHDSLKDQMVDLRESMQQIRQGIQKLNKTSRDLFADAFEQVDEHLRSLYPRLSGGGKAYLTLTNPDDLLETGIEVHVQPPGKKLKAMGLLSGGEKAMAALALVFSVFLYRPSPFCLLDEVDAELDEANVRRFNQLLKEMGELTQFIVISHKRHTMEEADVLFGVTMEKPGISKLVTVKLEEAQELTT